MSMYHREQRTAQRPSVKCRRCGILGWFDRDWVHNRVPSFPHRFVPVTPTEAQQERLEAQHAADYGHVHDGAYAEQGCYECEAHLKSAFLSWKRGGLPTREEIEESL